jgi:hypothetical protein
MKSAVDWAINEILNNWYDYEYGDADMDDLIEQAKKMEKEQTLNFERLLMEHEINSLTFDNTYLTPEEFYDKTYNSK